MKNWRFQIVIKFSTALNSNLCIIEYFCAKIADSSQNEQFVRKLCLSKLNYKSNLLSFLHRAESFSDVLSQFEEIDERNIEQRTYPHHRIPRFWSFTGRLVVILYSWFFLIQFQGTKNFLRIGKEFECFCSNYRKIGMMEVWVRIRNIGRCITNISFYLLLNLTFKNLLLWHCLMQLLESCVNDCKTKKIIYCIDFP